MSEPPLPIVPTGETRNFDLTMPGTGTFGGVGSGSDPSGAADVTECQAELESLVAAVNANPDPVNTSALFAFIQNRTGQSMEELLGTTWAELIADGETQTVQIEIPECNAIVGLTLGGDLNTTANCYYLPVPDPISFGVNDFHMPVVQTISADPEETGLIAHQWVITRHADIDVHLEDPEFVYLERYGAGGGRDQTLSTALDARIGVYQRVEYGCTVMPTGVPYFYGPTWSGGVSYCPWWRIKGRWTCKIEETYESVTQLVFGSGITTTQTWKYSTRFPLMGFHPVLGLKDPPEDLTIWRDIDDPVVLATVNENTGTGTYRYSMSSAGIGFGVDAAPFVGYTGSELPQNGGVGFAEGMGPNGRTNGWNLPQMAIGDPDIFRAGGTFGLPPESPGVYNWTRVGATDQAENVKLLYFLGTSTYAQIEGDPPTVAENAQDAWNRFVAEIEEYQAFAGPYDPVVELDQENMEVHVSFETDLNALHLPLVGCSSFIFAEDDAEQTLSRTYGTSEFWTMSWGGYWHDSSWATDTTVAAYDDTIPYNSGDPDTSIPGAAGNYTAPGDPHEGSWYRTGPQWQNALAARIARDWAEDNAGWARTNTYRKPLPRVVGTYNPIIEAAEESFPTEDGNPPPTVTNPPITPLGGGCRSYLEGPSSCNWNVPVPASPQPEMPDLETPHFPMPNDLFPDAPVIDTNLPLLPSLPCTVPDFGNFDPCGKGTKRPDGSFAGGRGGGGGPGYMGSVPGGRDWQGNRGSAGTVAGVKTGGQTYVARSYLFTEETCPGIVTPGIGSMAVIVQLLMDCGIAPIDIIFQIGPEWDKPFPADKCFTRGSRIFDAAMWTARYLMCTIVDEGPPTNDVYIGPPWHRPLQTTWTFDEHYDLFGLSRGMSSEESYGWVEVFGPNITTPVITRINDPFSTIDSPTLRLEAGANYSQVDAEGLAAYKASFVLREAVSVQAIVPYSSEYFLRDLMLLQAPDRGFQETYVITGKESDVSPAGWFHILTGMLPATLAELDAFPTVTDEYDAIEGGFA